MTAARFWRFNLCVLAFVTSAIQVEKCWSANEPLQCGFAVADITPPVGYRLSGYFHERISTDIADRLQAKAVVLQQGDQRVAWLFCDLVGVPIHISDSVRSEIAKRTEIPRENIMVAATHTHTGPLYFGPLRNYFHSVAIENHGTDPHESLDYAKKLGDDLVALVQEAINDLAPTELAAGTTQQEGLAFNRRFVMRDGSVRTNPGKLNPDILRPAGPIDPEIGLIQFRRENRPIAGLTVFALHLDTIGGTEFSADFPFYLERSFRRRFGPDYLSLFGIGTCGDINHVDVTHNRPQTSSEESGRIGRILASTAAAALDDLEPIHQPLLAVASETLQVPLQRYTDLEVAEARKQLRNLGTRKLPMLEQVQTVKIVGIDELETQHLLMEVQVFRLSNSVAIVALPGEVFVELGLSIKQQSPFDTTIIVELSNDYPGYIPTRRAFAEGSYETTNSKIRPGGGEQLVDTAAKLLNKLHAK